MCINKDNAPSDEKIKCKENLTLLWKKYILICILIFSNIYKNIGNNFSLLITMLFLLQCQVFLHYIFYF